MLKGTRNTPSKRRNLYPKWLGTSWNKQQNLITIVVHQDYQPQPYVFSRHRSIPIQHSCFPFPIPSSFLLRKRSCFLCFGSHSFLRLLLTFSESSDQYIWVSQSLLCCSQFLGCMSVCVCVCAFLITLGTHWSTCSMEVKEEVLFFLLTSVVAKPTIFASLT